jgi:hypothetical protein
MVHIPAIAVALDAGDVGGEEVEAVAVEVAAVAVPAAAWVGCGGR